MQLSSPAFANGEPVPEVHTCKGPNLSPPLIFSDPPPRTASFALVVEDIDAPNKWVHWLVYNIPASAGGLEQGQLPPGAVDGVCNGGTHGYEGPCPKYFAGRHRYRFTLYALDAPLALPFEADAPVVRARMQRHVLDTAELIGIAEGEQQQSA